ncbi:hypothetical protein JIQ42_05936 [Leishmania sp. Namibia]|uniref:hypothetical protein n=1 Tax=Leishmania sp. Namibia TaxID=2802991 RepID=UPI001B598AB4|nr:hypothetical protein JIQ42_05936 [Leishmania sp. Namibia]
MVHREPDACGGVPLPASMQTLLDRYADRRLTSKERLVLAQATPNVRCEALRIFFELNDASAGVEYVLANGGVSPRSHGGTGAGASRCSGSAATATASASGSATAASKALQLLPTNTLTTPRTVAKSHATAASAARRPVTAAAATASTAVKDRARKSTDTSRAIVTVNRSTARSPAARAGSCSRRSSAARRSDSVCTVVTVSSMSSEGSGDKDERRPTAMAAREQELQADNPRTVALRSRVSRDTTETTTTGPVVPALPLDIILRQHGRCRRIFESSHSAGVLEGQRRAVVSPAISTAASANLQPRGSSWTAVPGSSPGSRSLTTSELSTSATAAALRPAMAAPPPLPPTDHEDSVSDVELRKTMAAKSMVYYANPTATLTAPAPHPKRGHNAAFKGAGAMTAPGAHRSGYFPTFGHRQGNDETARTEPLLNDSRPFRASAPQSLVGGGVASVCGTDWAALVAAARAPQLPIFQAVAATKSPAAASASPPKSCRLAPGGVPRITPASSHGSPRPPAGKAHNRPKTAGNSESNSAPAAFYNSGRAGKAQKPQGALRVPCKAGKRQARASGKRSRRKARHPGKGTSRSSPIASASQLTVASPISRGVAWDDTMGTYITHPNQRRRQMATGCIAAATVLATPRPAASLSAGASALETPDTLHYYFSRTASLTVTSGNVATGQAPELLTRTPTATAAAHAAGSAPLGRLCSSALHLRGGEVVTSAPSSTAVLPLSMDTKRKKRAKVPARASTLKKYMQARDAAAVPATPPRAAPLVASPRLTGYQRLCSGYVPDMYDVYGQSQETVVLKRPALKYCAQMLETTVGGSPNRHPCTASAGPAVCPAAATASGARIERCCRKLRGGGAEVAAVKTAPSSKHAPWPSAARTPLSRCSPVHQHPHGMVRGPTAGMVYARVSATGPACPVPGAAAPASAGFVPAAESSVFERLASNYYDVYSSATALKARTPPPSAVFSRGGRSALKRHRPSRRRRRARGPATPQGACQGCLRPGEMDEGEPERIGVPPLSGLARGRSCRSFGF